MKFDKRKLVIISIALILALGSSVYLIFSRKSTVLSYKTTEEAEDVYVRFAMEAYDKVQENYWGKTDQYNLPQIYELSLEKVLTGVDVPTPADRAATARSVKFALDQATSTEARKNVVLQTVAVALYNLEPIGRNALFSDKQEKELRATVSNVDESSNLYGDLGLNKGATIDEVKAAYVAKESELSKTNTPEAAAELKKIEYAKEVLVDEGRKALYDEAKIEPTIKERLIGKTLYLDVDQIAPTTLWEIAKAVENASTTPGIKTMVIDFRGNVGGALDFLPAFLGLFIGPDQYAFDLFTQGEKKVFRTTQQKFEPMARYEEIAFLSDDKTQSTAELTIDAFKRYRLGKSVGGVTRGWGTVENTYPIETSINTEEKYTLLLVNSLTVRDDNQPIEGNGIIPNVDTKVANWKQLLNREFRSTDLIEAIKQVVK